MVRFQFFVRAGAILQSCYGVKDGGVMLAPEIARPISGSDAVVKLLDDIHGYLARESDGAGVAAHFQVLFAQVEMPR